MAKGRDYSPAKDTLPASLKFKYGINDDGLVLTGRGIPD